MDVMKKYFTLLPKSAFPAKKITHSKTTQKAGFFHEFNVEMLDTVVKQAMELKRDHKKANCCLIVDDFSEELKNPTTITRLKKIINKHRHLHLTIIISALSLKFIPKTIRGLIDYYILFKPKGLIELESYTEEIFGLSKKTMMKVLNFVFDGPHEFLMYGLKKSAFYKNFDRFTISGEDGVLEEVKETT